MESEYAVLSGMAAEMRSLVTAMERHEHTVDVIQRGHSEILERLTRIESTMLLIGSPVEAAVKMSHLEEQQKGLRAMVHAVIAAFGLAVASVSALIAGIIQALGGGGPRHGGG